MKERSSRRGSARCGSRRQAGHTFVEIVVVLALAGLTAAVSTVAWNAFQRKTATMQTARIFSSMVTQARMRAVHRGLDHFVVMDPANRTIAIHLDSSAPFGEFDSEDRRVALQSWPEYVSLGLPASALALPDPFGGETLHRAWSMPLPTGDAWRAGLRGFLATPSGAIASASDSPEVIARGVVVFSDASGHAVSVGIRGQFGLVEWFRLDGSRWKVG